MSIQQPLGSQQGGAQQEIQFRSPSKRTERHPVHGSLVLVVGSRPGSFETTAKQLYKSGAFKQATRYARKTDKPWGILSSRHGLAKPTGVIGPYDYDFRARSRNRDPVGPEWTEKVARQAEDKFGKALSSRIAVLAEPACRPSLCGQMSALGDRLDVSIQGLGCEGRVQWHSQGEEGP